MGDGRSTRGGLRSATMEGRHYEAFYWMMRVLEALVDALLDGE